MNISDPTVYTAIYEQHRRSVFAAAFRILGNEAQADDVVQDTFIKVWRKPESFDSKRGELGSYLRLMARSRALDLWREGQAAGRASDRLKNVVAVGAAQGGERPDQIVERGEATDSVVSAAHATREPARGSCARLLGRAHRRRGGVPRCRAAWNGQEPNSPRSLEAA